MPTLSIAEVSRSYARHSVLHGISLELAAGELTVLLGGNGSGKSTLLGICAGLIRPESGTVSFDGVATKGGARVPYSRIGYMTHEPLLYGELTVFENLRLVSTLSGSTVDIEAAVRYWELSPEVHRPVRELSRGKRSTAALCRCFLTNPDFLLLDEPTTALDFDATKLVLARIGERCGKGAAALVATHDLAAFENAATRIVVLSGGALVADTAALVADGATLSAARSQALAAYRRSNR